MMYRGDRRASERDPAGADGAWSGQRWGREHLDTYERDPAHTPSAEARLQREVREPARRDAADRHAEALGAAQGAEQKSRQAEQAAGNRAEAHALVHALRQATQASLHGVVARLVAARRHGELDAGVAEPMAQSLARVLAEAVATRTRVPELAQAARALGAVVRSAAFERIEADLGRMLERLEPLLVTRAGALGEPAFSVAVDAAALADELQRTVEQLVREAERKAPRLGLPLALRARMEQSLGEDLGGVVLHRESAAAGGAKAVTVGEAIHLGPGQGPLESEAGERVLGHELVHVVQQRGRGKALPAGLGAADRREVLEEEAGRLGEAAARGERVEVELQAEPGERQGFDAYEHRRIAREGGGGRMLRLECGLELPFEEAVWMAGDLYGSFAALKWAPKEEVEELLRIVARQEGHATRRGGRPSAAEQAEVDSALQRATAWRERPHYDRHRRTESTEGEVRFGEGRSYETLAKENHKHFAGANLEKWRKEHKEAKKAAYRAYAFPLKLAQHLNEALLHEAFGAHFLTDAFAAGHLVDGARGRAWAQDMVDAEYPQLKAAVVSAAKADQEASARIAEQEAGGAAELLVYGVTDLVYSISVYLTRTSKGALASLLLKVVHDHFNASGLTVRNPRGDVWRTAGDLQLHEVPRTRALAAEAVRLGREEVEAMAQGTPWRGPSAAELVPSAVELGGRWWPLAEFQLSQEVFLGVLRPRIFDPTPANRLYQMIRDNLRPVAQNQGRELGIGATRAVGHGTAQALEMVGESEKRNAEVTMATGQALLGAGRALGHGAVGALERVGESEKRNAAASLAGGQALIDGAVWAAKAVAAGAKDVGRAVLGLGGEEQKTDSGKSGVDLPDGGVP